MELLAAIRLYYTCALRSNRNRLSSIAFSSLTQEHSYRLHASAHHDLLIGARYLLRALRLIHRGTQEELIWDASSGIMVFDGDSRSAEDRKSYVETITSEKLFGLVSKEELGFTQPILLRLLESILLLMFAISLSPVLLFSKKRGSYALNLLELVEMARLIQRLKARKIQKLYYFCSFNKDSNFVALRMREVGIYCHKVPSSNPIRNFYKMVIADEFSFTAPFQRFEWEGLGASWFVNTYSEWPVFHFQRIQAILKDFRKPEANTLGFISSAIWRRQERGDMAFGIGETEAELQLIEVLKHFLTGHPEVRFSVFFHPLEKRDPEVYQRACAHYEQVFAPAEVHFFPADLPTYKLFDQVDVSITAYSSTNLERLYAGFKTLYAPLGMPRDYYAGSELENIAIFDEVYLPSALEEALSVDTEGFFRQHELKRYHHDYYAALFKD